MAEEENTLQGTLVSNIVNAWEPDPQKRRETCNNIYKWMQENKGKFTHDVVEKLLSQTTSMFQFHHKGRMWVSSDYWGKLWAYNCAKVIEFIIDDDLLRPFFINRPIVIKHNVIDSKPWFTSSPFLYASGIDSLDSIAQKIVLYGGKIGQDGPGPVTLAKAYSWPLEIFKKFVDNLISEGFGVDQCFNFGFYPVNTPLNIFYLPSANFYEKTKYLLDNGLDLSRNICKFKKYKYVRISIFDVLVHSLAKCYMDQKKYYINNKFKKDILKTIQLLVDQGGELTSPPVSEFSFDMTREERKKNTEAEYAQISLSQERRKWPREIKEILHMV